MRAIVTGAVLLCSVFLPGQMFGQQTVTVQDIELYGQRYLNRYVQVEGQILEVQAEPQGTSRGWYSIANQTTENAVSVWTPRLPAPGQIVRVTGEVQQHPRNARQLIILEDERCLVGSLFGCDSSWLVLLAALIAIGLLAYLIYVMIQRPGNGRTRPVTSRPSVYEGPTLEFTESAQRRSTGSTAGSGTADPKVTREFHQWGARITVSEGPDAGMSVPIGESPFFVGRKGGRENNLSLSDPTVSRAHAKIVHNQGSDSFSIVNESERNPIEVNGRVVDATEIQTGSKVRMGATTLEFERST